MYQDAKKKYEALGLDVEAVLKKLADTPLSIHCWQGDDVLGFMNSGSLTGGIQTTGNYPGKARNFEELSSDLAFAFSLMPGKKRLNLHAIYAVSKDKGLEDVDKLDVEDFRPWMDWAKEHDCALDFNPTCFSNPKMKNGLSLSSPDEATRTFWVNHCKACRAIAEEFGKAQGSPCLVNIWIPDGLKEIPADRLGPRQRLKKSLDEIYAVKYDKKYVLDAVESKVFGIGVESYTVGSNEFYQNYAALNGVYSLIDNGHYHPTENVADKIATMLTFYDKMALHMTRSVRWDSDHVVLMDDVMKEICDEVVRCDGLDKVIMALDYFDASINRIAAYVIGQRSVQKCLLASMLTPWDKLKEFQDAGDYTHMMALREQLKMLPLGEIWEEYLNRQGLSEDFMPIVDKYEKEVLSLRK